MAATTSTMAAAQNFISVQPEELKFRFELEKLSCCDIKVTNNTENHIVFKVKTTSPKKYFVRPNIGVLQPWDSCVIRVTLQAQREYPPNMQCKDKFLLLSTVVPPNTNVDDLPEDTFNKEVGGALQECKLRVLYVTPNTARANSDDVDANSNEGLQRLSEERDAAVKQKQQLQQQVDALKKRRKGNGTFSLKFAVIVGVIGICMGFILNLLLSSPSTEE